MFDSHLSQFQKTRDGFCGHGTLRAKIKELGQEAAANIEWGDGFKNIEIVEKASNPAEVAAIEEDAKRGRFGDLDLTVFYGYSKKRFQAGLLRCAYLALFKCFGYEYARHDVVQIIRRRISNTFGGDYPRLGSLIGELRDGTVPYPRPYMIVPGNSNDVQFYLVIIQLRKKTTSYHFVFMPIPGARCDEFFHMMERCSSDNDGKKFTIPHRFIFW